MSKEYIQYGNRLNTIGDIMIEANNLKEAKEEEKLRIAIDRYCYAIESLEDVKTPNIIINEHQKLIKELNEWLEATKEISTITQELNRVSKLHKEKEGLIVKITELIGDKIIEDMKK